MILLYFDYVSEEIFSFSVSCAWHFYRMQHKEPKNRYLLTYLLLKLNKNYTITAHILKETGKSLTTSWWYFGKFNSYFPCHISHTFLEWPIQYLQLNWLFFRYFLYNLYNYLCSHFDLISTGFCQKTVCEIRWILRKTFFYCIYIWGTSIHIPILNISSMLFFV